MELISSMKKKILYCSVFDNLFYTVLYIFVCVIKLQSSIKIQINTDFFIHRLFYHRLYYTIQHIKIRTI